MNPAHNSSLFWDLLSIGLIGALTLSFATAMWWIFISEKDGD